MDRRSRSRASAESRADSVASEISPLLTAALHAPWSSPAHLASFTGASADQVVQGIYLLVGKGTLLTVTQALSSYPSTLIAPSTAGIHAVASTADIPLQVLSKQLHLTPDRYWILRAALEYANDLYAIRTVTAHGLAANKPFQSLDFEFFLPRVYKAEEIYIHGNLALHTATRAYPYFLLLDHGDAPVWQWYPQLRCLNRMARSAQTPGFFPPLLIVSTRDFRASAMLALARIAGTTLTVAATALRDVALESGLFAVTRERGWHSLKPNGTLATVDPFRVPGLEQTVYRRSHFVVRKLTQLRTQRTAVADTPPAQVDLERPALLEGLEHLEALTDSPYHLLTFLVRHPIMPVSALSTLLAASVEEVERDLSILQEHNLAERISAPHTLDESIWAATDMALCLRMAREMQPMSALKRYRFYRRDAKRHLFHTLAVHRFFETLKKRCDGRSRATRRLDTPPAALNTGHIPYYELSVFESEVMACDWYVSDGQARHWRPDGYGALRAGTTYTRFWLEMDGTLQAPSRKDPVVWEGKMGRLCDYIQSRRWALRYPQVPRLLVVTTDLVNRALLYDALVAAARARTMRPLPAVYMTSTSALHQRGPLGQIWHHVSAGSDPDRDALRYAFDGVEPLAVHARQPNQEE